jgi:predicted metal-dependent phosphoesterase TrpH
MVDLHTHTDESDGSLRPLELVEAAKQAGLEALAITDHDTFAGFEQAAGAGGLRLIRGIELNTKLEGRSVHLLAYFTNGEPKPEFTRWLGDMVDARRDRNRRLIEKLHTLGIEIELAEVEALGRTLTGRPHFARVLVEKGYAANRNEAFNKYVGETGDAFVERESPAFEEAVRLIAESGGISSLAHPIRLGKRDATAEERFLAGLRTTGLDAIEVYHSDHKLHDIDRYRGIAQRHGFSATGGSDFHGSYKPNVRLGYAANGLLRVPPAVLAALEAR